MEIENMERNVHRGANSVMETCLDNSQVAECARLETREEFNAGFERKEIKRIRLIVQQGVAKFLTISICLIIASLAILGLSLYFVVHIMTKNVREVGFMSFIDYLHVSMGAVQFIWSVMTVQKCLMHLCGVESNGSAKVCH